MDADQGRGLLFTVADLASVLGTGALTRGQRATGIYGVRTDSRCVSPGDLFVALEGEKTDGHQYLDAAFSRGAAAALVRAGKVSRRDQILLEVPDPFWAVGDVASWYRGRFSLPVIAVTGSVGKTTCKDMMAAVLQQSFEVLKTRGNYNTEIGVPLTLFELRSKHQAAVVELAMRKLGDIEYLASVAGPEAGVLTNVTESHIEYLGSVENIARAKAELFEALSGQGWAVINCDDPWGRWIASRTEARTVFYGMQPGDDLQVWAENISIDGLARARFDLHVRGEPAVRVHLPLAGKHHVANALAAACAGHMMGISSESIRAGLENVELTGMRMQWIQRDRINILDDTYNSSPTSCMAALDTLAECAAAGRKVAILGDMLELGSRSGQWHLEVGRHLAAGDLDVLVTVGELASLMGTGAVDEGFAAGSHRHYPDNDALIADLPEMIADGDLVLVKASRGCRLESCVEALKALFPPRETREMGSGG